MEVVRFSKTYNVRPLCDAQVDEVYALCSGNPIYYEHCPPPVTRASIREDMNMLPPGKTMKDKYYVGFYAGDKLIAVMDLIDGYPQKEIAYIGFFMTEAAIQNRGVGAGMIEELCEYLSRLGSPFKNFCKGASSMIE